MDTSKFNICVTARVDESSVRGNAVASGDDAYDKAVEDGIIDAVNGGNVWAWASVCVTVSPKDPEFCDLEESDYLGCCSYESKSDFIKNSGYYEEMVSECISRLEVAMGGVK